MKRIESIVAGHVIAVDATVGAAIGAGDALVTVESMKMEIPIEAETGGTVRAVLVAVGDEVAEGQVVVELE